MCQVLACLADLMEGRMNNEMIDEYGAPYRFIRHEKVFIPDLPLPRFDMPYENAKSGVINITIKALSPIFVGDEKPKQNENGKQSNESNEPQEFFKINDKYCIPGSSIRGVIRNLCEMISFSKLKTQDIKPSYRDLNNESYKNNLLKQAASSIYAGWLRKNNDKWEIYDTGKLASKCRILYKDDILNPSSENTIADVFNLNIANSIKESKTASEKYKIVGGLEKCKYSEVNNGIDEKYCVVFTGSTGNKTREFRFPQPTDDSKWKILDSKVKATFRQAYGLDDTRNKSEHWKYLETSFKKGQPIPIFFKKSSSGIEHFGLSYLYKLPYKYSTQDLLEKIQNQTCPKPDFAQRIFGYTAENNKIPKALKSRISFSHFELKNEPKIHRDELILSSPKITFYPFYLEQNGGKLITYDDSNARLNGFKIYPPHKNHALAGAIKSENKNIASKIKALEKNSEFSGQLRYFNLLECELGLLLLALSIFDGKETCYKIGGAKPYGYGNCEIKLSGISDEDKNKAILAFKNKLGDFDIKARIQELENKFKINNDFKLEYMELPKFAEIKKEQPNQPPIIKNNQNPLCKPDRKSKPKKSTKNKP